MLSFRRTRPIEKVFTTLRSRSKLRKRAPSPNNLRQKPVEEILAAAIFRYRWGTWASGHDSIPCSDFDHSGSASVVSHCRHLLHEYLLQRKNMLLRAAWDFEQHRDEETAFQFVSENGIQPNKQQA